MEALRGSLLNASYVSPGAAWAEGNKDVAHTGLLPPATLGPSPATFSLPFHFSLASSLLLLTTGPSFGPACCIGFQYLSTDRLQSSCHLL